MHLKKLPVFLLTAIMLLIFHPGDPLIRAEDTSATADSSGIGYKDGLLKVSAENQELKDVLKEVARKTGVDIITEYISDETVSVHFGYRPLEEGLQQLIGERSYILFYSSESGPQDVRLSRALILPKGGGAHGASAAEMYQKRPENAARNSEVEHSTASLKNILQKKLEEISNQRSDTMTGAGDHNNELVNFLKNYMQKNRDVSEDFIRLVNDLQGDKAPSQQTDSEGNPLNSESAQDEVNTSTGKSLNKVLNQVFDKNNNTGTLPP